MSITVNPKPVKITRKHKINCPACRGTGLEYEEARLLWERKQGISQNELTWLICKKLNGKHYDTDFTHYVNMRITQTDIFNIIKMRELWVPCKSCKGKGVVHI